MKHKPKVQGRIMGVEFTEAFRQGEILFFKVADDNVKIHPHTKVQRIASGVIRTGEKEGHEHKVEGDGNLSLFPDALAPTPGETQEQPSQGVVEVGKEGAKVTHPEHADIKLPKGKYIVQTQKEAVGKNKHQSVKD
jgi:hypothetical protein